jgi:putative ABC transport system permease protein
MKHAIRSLGRSPGFAVIAAFLLAVGIAANLTAFNLIDPLFLSALPVTHAREIAQISGVDKDGRERQLFSTILTSMRAETLFRGVCGFDMPSLATEVQGALQSRPALTLTGDCFETLGIGTAIGRPLLPADDQVGAPPVVWLTDPLWRTAFDSAPDVIGKQIKVKGLPYTIVGITEPRFSGLIAGFPADVIMPLAQIPVDPSARRDTRGQSWVSVVARLQPSATEEQVATTVRTREQAWLSESAASFASENERKSYLNLHLTSRIGSIRSETLLYGGFARRFETPLFTLWGICALMLLVTCSNVAILFLGRGIARQPEMAIRLALGGSRISIIRLLVWETTLVVLAGAALGLMLARWMNTAVAATAADMFALVLPTTGSPWLGARSALYLVVLIVVLSAALALVAIWQGLRLSRADGWRQSGRAIVGASTRGQKVLLAVQLAVTLTLIAGSGSLTATMREIYDLNLGLNTNDVSVTHLVPIPGIPRPAASGSHDRELVRQLEALPNVTAASLSTFVPLGGGTFFVPLAAADTPVGGELRTLTATVSERYFDTLGIPIVAGERFRPIDANARDAGAEGTAIVSQSVAKQFGNDRIIGQTIFLGDRASATRLRVIGIAQDAQVSFGRRYLRTPPFVYLSLWEHPETQASYAIAKTRPGTTVPRASVRQILASLGREYEDDFHTLSQAKDQALVEGRLLAEVLAAASSLSLLLAATGLFGVISYFVTSRTREIGVRMALGANRSNIHARVLRELVPMMASGMLGGLVLTFLFSRIAASQVSEFSAQAAWLLPLSLAILIAAAALAVLVPARRATSVDPTVALRGD